MDHSKADFDILGRIEQEKNKRGWSEYTLAENSELPQSTISTWKKRDLQPSVASIEKICKGLGISLSQFFSDNIESDFTEEQKEIFDACSKLNREQRAKLLDFLKTIE